MSTLNQSRVYSYLWKHDGNISSRQRRRSYHHTDWLTTEEQVHEALSASSSTPHELRILQTFRSDPIALHRLWFRIKYHSKQSLSSLALRGVRMDIEDVDHLFQAAPALKQLQLGPVTLSGLNHLLSLSLLSNLEHLDLTGSADMSISDHERLSLSSILSSSKLKVLRLCHVPLVFSDTCFDKPSRKTPTIQTLKLTHCDLNDQDVIDCIDSGLWLYLQKLDLSHNHIQHASTLIRLLKELPYLETLRMDHNPCILSKNLFNKLVTAIGQTRVRCFSLDHHLDPSLVHAIAEGLQANVHLRWVSCVSSPSYHSDSDQCNASVYTKLQLQEYENRVAYLTLLNRNGRSCIRQSVAWYPEVLAQPNPVAIYGLLCDQMHWLSWAVA